MSYELKLRFGEVAYALGMTGKTTPLRNWLRRGQVKIEGGYGGGWATFTIRDLIALAIIQRLVEHGLGVERARNLVEPALRAVWLPEYDADPELAMPSRGKVAKQKAPPLPPQLYMFKDHQGKERIDWGTAGDIVNANSWVGIDVHGTINSVLTRLSESMASSQKFEPERVLDALRTLEAREIEDAQRAKEAAKQAAMRDVQAAMRKVGVAIAFASDGTVNVLAEKPKAVSRKRRKKRAPKS